MLAIVLDQTGNRLPTTSNVRAKVVTTMISAMGRVVVESAALCLGTIGPMHG